MKDNRTCGGWKMEAPKVSVLMLTYNHSRFVARAVQSVMDQETSFSYELLIGDDASDDGAGTILNCFQKVHPNVTVIRSDRNRGMYHNLAQIYYRARGEYIAFLEGDDFWISPDKLETQVRHLEEHRDTVLCFHQARLFRNGEFTGEVFPQVPERALVFEDFLQENWVPTCSAVFRRLALDSIPAWCADLDMLDWPIFLLLSEKGRVTYLPEIASAYRIHAMGAWSSLPPEAKSERMIKVLRAVRKHFGRKGASLIDRRISELYEHIAWCCEERKALNAALLASWKATLAAPILKSHALTSCLRLAFRSTLMH